MSDQLPIDHLPSVDANLSLEVAAEMKAESSSSIENGGECDSQPVAEAHSDEEIASAGSESLSVAEVEYDSFENLHEDFEEDEDEDSTAVIDDAVDFDVISDEDDFDGVEDEVISEADGGDDEVLGGEYADNDPSPARRSFKKEPPRVAQCAPQRLAKILAAAGIDARRKCEEYVTTGRVTVDGKVITDLAFRADPFSQKIELDGEKLKVHRKVYFILNKPRGVVCTNFDPSGRPRVLDMFPQFKERLFTIGRLDEESEGLLLVTNDGELANRMAHPRYRVPKFYSCHVKGIPSAETLASLKRGMYFDEGKFAVEGVRMRKVAGDSSHLDIVLNEGQNREIRRLLARVDHKVMRLKRVGFGPIRLGELPAGGFRPLSPAEVGLLNDLSQQRAHLDNTAGKVRKKKFGEKPKFGGANRPAYGAKPAYGQPSGDAPPRGRSQSADRPASDAKRPYSGEKRYGSRPAYGAQSGSEGRPPRRQFTPQADRDFENNDFDDFTPTEETAERPVRQQRFGGRFPQTDGQQSGGPRRYGNDAPASRGPARTFQRGPQGRDQQGQTGNFRQRQQGSSQEGPGNQRPPRRIQSDDAVRSFNSQAAENEFVGDRRRFVTDDTQESSFNQRPARPPRPPRGQYRSPQTGNDGQGDQSQGEYRQQRRPVRGPQRPGQNRFSQAPGAAGSGDRRRAANRFAQAVGREIPARAQRPPRPMTEDGKEILQGKVTGYRSIPKEGVGRRKRTAVTGMQINRKVRQQKRKRPGSE